MLEERISLRHLRLMDAIAREGSLARAAERLSMTQSAVTKGLQEAEAVAGVPLFNRTSRGSVPTPYGERLVEHARTVLAQLRRASRELTELKEGHGSITVGALPSASGGLLPQAIAQVMAERPQLRITVIEGPHDVLTTRLRRSELDLVVGRLPPRRLPDDVAQETLGPDRARLVVRTGHPLTQGTPPTLASLRGYRWILPHPDMALRRLIETAFQDGGLQPPEAHVESTAFLTNRALLLAGDFITVWPHHLADVEAAQGLVTVLPIELPTTERPMGAWWRAEAGLSHAGRLLVDALQRASGPG